MKKIIIYYTFPIIPTAGGIERVSCVLGDWLRSKGLCVYYLSDTFTDDKIILKNNGVGLRNRENKKCLEDFIKKEKIDCIINQASIFRASEPLLLLDRGDAKLISVVHNSLYGMFSNPDWNVWNKALQKIVDSKLIKWISRKFFYFKYHNLLQLMASQSDAVVLLSESYKYEIKYFTGYEHNNLIAIGNPLTLPLDNVKYNKNKEIIFLGRLSWQKRPDVMLDIWEKTVVHIPGWSLRFVGDGPMYPLLQKRIQQKHIPNVHLEGQKEPIEFLKKASILCMTSCYEGFPLVLFEAMNYGVVPIAFNSFSALEDIIDDRENGYIIPMGNRDSYIQKLIGLINDERLRKNMSIKCQKKASENTCETLGIKWLELFDRISK